MVVTTTKGNDGRAARRQLLRRIGLVLGIFGVCLSLLVLLGVGGRQRRRRRFAFLDMGFRSPQEPQHPFQLDTTPLITNEKQVEEMILSAQLHLVDLEVDYEELAYSPSETYAGIYGRFCPLNFAAHKKNPTEVPMFRDLVAASPGCQRVYWKMDLQRIATLARNYDQRQQSATNNNNHIHSLNLTAVVFHESRCGSTLVANSLMASNPDEHRVYSESSPPIVAMRLCGDLFESCRVDQAVRILQDTLYLMGRSNDPKETRVFYKIQSIGTRFIDIFLQAFPTTPWLFVYRDPVQVMMSHLGAGDNMAYANCVRQYNQPPPVVVELLQRRLNIPNDPHPDDVSYEDYCAAYLASITERAVEALRTSKYGHAIHYPDLPQILYQDVLPNKLGVSLNDQQIARIIHIASQYSKGRASGQRGEWHEDSKQKERHATQTIKAAARLFLENSYNELVKMSQNDKGANAR